MVQDWRLLAALLFLPLLSLSAQSDGQAIAYDETADMGWDFGTVSDRQVPKEVQLPEEETIRSLPVITPSVAPQIVDGPDIFFTGDFIWWRTSIDGMQYAYSGVADGTFATTGGSTGQGSANNPGFSYEPGFKAGFGWHIDHDGWDMTTEWTHLFGGDQRSSSGVAPGGGVGMSAIQEIVLSNGTIELLDLSAAASKWKQDFNVIDLELGRDFFLSRYLTMRPHIGFKSAWIHESTTNTLTPIPITFNDNIKDVAQIGVSQAVLKNYEHMWGIGIRSGFDLGFRLMKNIMIYGDLAFTNMWGKFKNYSRQRVTEYVPLARGTNLPLGTFTTADTIERYSTLIPVIEYGLGLSFIGWLAKNSVRIETRVGWEAQVWIDYNRSQDYLRVGTLSVQGLTAKAMFNF